MPYADLPGVDLWYTDSGGDGPPVVFIHAAAGSSESWVNQLPAFTEAGFRCLTYDQRGWLRSKAKPGAGLGHASDDLLALADHLAIGKFHLIANAYGGFGGVDFALRYPDRLLSFVLSDSQGGLDDPDYVALRTRIAPPALRALPIELRELGPTYRTENPYGTSEWLRLIHEAGGETAERQPPALRIRLTTLERLRVPTLMICGDADLLSPPGLMRILAARVPDCRLVTIPEAGHSAYWERPADWNRAVLEFLRAR